MQHTQTALDKFLGEAAKEFSKLKNRTININILENVEIMDWKKYINIIQTNETNKRKVKINIKHKQTVKKNLNRKHCYSQLICTPSTCLKDSQLHSAPNTSLRYRNCI